MNNTMELNIGDVIECTISGIKPYGCFVKINNTSLNGFCHISELDSNFISDVNKSFKLNEVRYAKLLSFDESKSRYNVSFKQANIKPQPQKTEIKKAFKPHKQNKEKEELNSFESMMKQFTKNSEEKFRDLNKRNKRRK